MFGDKAKDFPENLSCLTRRKGTAIGTKTFFLLYAVLEWIEYLSTLLVRSMPDAALSDDSDMELESPFVDDDFPAYSEGRPSALIPDK